MTNRNVQYPKRYQMAPVQGTTDIVDLTPAPGEVYDEGTMINKATLLKDTTAALYGLGTDAVPDDVLALLSKSALYKTITPTAQLGTLAEGSIIYLNENGSPVPFYVAKQGYEPSYNTDRVLVVRKEAVQSGQWNSANSNAYINSTIDSWFNNTYLQTLDSNVQAEIGTTNIPYTPDYYNQQLSRVNKAVFALSATEFGVNNANVNVEGDAISLYSQVKLVGTIWTRSPSKNTTNEAGTISVAGSGVGNVTTTNMYLPAFTLPTSFLASLGSTTGLYDLSNNLLLKLPGVQIETGSYTGTGTYGANNPNVLTFSDPPQLIILTMRDPHNGAGYVYYAGTPGNILAFKDLPTTYTIGFGFTQSSALSTSYAKRDGNSLYWYNTQGDAWQLNGAGFVYRYLVFY